MISAVGFATRRSPFFGIVRESDKPQPPLTFRAIPPAHDVAVRAAITAASPTIQRTIVMSLILAHHVVGKDGQCCRPGLPHGGMEPRARRRRQLTGVNSDLGLIQSTERAASAPLGLTSESHHSAPIIRICVCRAGAISA
jgi:hypothetical protein